MQQRIVNDVGDKPEDLVLWRACCVYWMGHGWNPKNIDGQLERFNEQWAENGPGEYHEEVIDGVKYNVYQSGARELATNIPD